MARVSVIVPVYKVEQYLRRCVDSLLSQTFCDFELILVDDGSPDNCGRICDEYASKDRRVMSLHRNNGGLSAARNTGLDWVFANSASRYVAFVDSDDWVDGRYLETLVRGVSLGTMVSCVCCRHVMEGDALPEPRCDVPGCRMMSPKEYWLNVDLYMTAWGKLYDRRLWATLRFPEGKVHEDEYVAHKLLFVNREIAVSRECLYYYFQRKDSIMQDGNKKRRLDLIGAFSSQIEFFREHGFPDLMLQAKVKLLKVYVYAIGELQALECKARLQEAMRDEPVPILLCPEAYRVLHPVRMLWLWPYLRARDVLSRRGLIGAIRQWLRHQ